MKQEHGQSGQLNWYVLDVESSATGFGKHKRCIPGYYARRGIVDVVVCCSPAHTAHLPLPTLAQVRKVATGERRAHPRGRLTYIGAESWTHEDREYITHTFKLVRQ